MKQNEFNLATVGLSFNREREKRRFVYSKRLGEAQAQESFVAFGHLLGVVELCGCCEFYNCRVGQDCVSRSSLAFISFIQALFVESSCKLQYVYYVFS